MLAGAQDQDEDPFGRVVGRGGHQCNTYLLQGSWKLGLLGGISSVGAPGYYVRSNGQSYGWRRLKENRRKYFACCKTGISENNVARPAENWMDQRVKNLVCFKATEIQPAGNNH